MSPLASPARRFTRTSLVLMAASGIAVSTLAVAAVPAQAAGIGTGRAVVHVDAPQATTVKQADGSYLLSMPKGTTGQWMGERKIASGKTKTLVGNLTGEKLASSWSNLKYTSTGVVGTLVWDSTATTPQTAVVHVMRPKATDTGVTFSLMTKQELPATMSSVMLNLDRAPKKKSTRSSSPQQANIASDLWWSSSSNGSSVTLRIYNSTNNNTCFTDTQNASSNLKSVGSNTCDNIAYTDADNVGTPNSSGAYSVWKDENHNSDMDNLYQTQMSLLLTPPNQAQYKYVKVFSY